MTTPTATEYVGRHRAEADDPTGYVFDPMDPCDRYEVEEVKEVLSAMPLDPDLLGDGGPSDWTLSILFAVAGLGDPDASEWVLPRLQTAALAILSDLGYPGPGFAGA